MQYRPERTRSWFSATDIPYGSNQVSRFGVEETVVDGVILLSSVEEGLERERYVEIYKLRNTAHLKGRHNLMIGEGGISVFPRYLGDASSEEKAPPSVDVTERLQSGTPGFDELIGGGFLKRSIRIDGVSNILGGSSLGNDELRQLLYKLAVRFKALGVTSIFTLESKSIFSTDTATDREFSPIADNLVMFRYLATERKWEPTVIVVKTRGSEHDRHTYSLEIGKGGMRIGRSWGEAPEKKHLIGKKSRSI